jgi:hypothetical protein
MVPRPTTRKQPKREDHKMLEQTPVKRSLMELELEVEAEGREWMRQRLQEKLQAEADREGRVFSPQRTKGNSSSHRVDATAKRQRHR